MNSRLNCSNPTETQFKKKKKKSKTQMQNSKHVSKPCLKIRILKLKTYFSPVNVCSRAHISKSFLQILILIICLSTADKGKN